jgi:uncharacterized protein (TIGR01244 family)
MRNAIKYDDRITIGSVPTLEDIEQLRELGYKTLIDVRDEAERFGGKVEKEALRRGMTYVSIPVSHTEIMLDDVKTFYQVVFGKGSSPIYAFSRFGKRPLAFLILFEVVARREPTVRICQRAVEYGLPLEGDILLQAFLVKMANTGALAPIVELILEHRRDLIKLIKPI